MLASSSAAASYVGQQAQTKTALASEFVKQNAQAEASVANLVEESSQNLQQVSSSTAPGTGQNVDRSV